MSEWKPICGYDNYFASPEGYIVSSKGSFNRRLKSGKTIDGYLHVSLSKNNIQKSTSVARLVAKAFIPNPDNLDTVNHKDGNKLNNSVDNLEWMSKRDNTLHALKNGLHPKKMIPVNIFDETGLVAICESIREAERLTGINHSTILKAINKDRYVNGKYMFAGIESADIPPE